MNIFKQAVLSYLVICRDLCTLQKIFYQQFVISENFLQFYAGRQSRKMSNFNYGQFQSVREAVIDTVSQ